MIDDDPATDKAPAQPQGGEAAEDAETLGTCYAGSDCTGNVLGNGVTKSDCWNQLRGRSWRGNNRCWEN